MVLRSSSCVLPLALVLAAACQPSPANPGSGVRSAEGPAASANEAGEASTSGKREGPVRLEPRTESMQEAATVGRGVERCPLYVYPWDAAKPGCKISVTHCTKDTDGQRCAAMVDERSIACGGTEAICGEEVGCDCPKGAPRPVDDAPGTITLAPLKKGQVWSAPGCRAAAVDALPGIGAPPFPACLILVNDCDAGQSCPERSETLSCGIRSPICGRPVHCACSP